MGCPVLELPAHSGFDARRFADVLCAVFSSLERQERLFNRMDARVGDGDTGTGVAAASRAVLDLLPWDDRLPESVAALGTVIAEAFGGTCGPLYNAFLGAAAAALPSHARLAGIEHFCAAFKKGAEAVEAVGGAKLGERTMCDVLHPVAVAFHQQLGKRPAVTPKEVCGELVRVARLAADGVRSMRATKGRSRYLAGKEVGEADPGSELVVAWLSHTLATLFYSSC